mmetsp:Transcript_118147/g.271097  ORF Transcript_118147/g.271097 Transcript_118147/m.271097 type:complete len:211 (+) Transcript_118147:44-676(+)
MVKSIPMSLANPLFVGHDNGTLRVRHGFVDVHCDAKVGAQEDNLDLVMVQRCAVPDAKAVITSDGEMGVVVESEEDWCLVKLFSGSTVAVHPSEVFECGSLGHLIHMCTPRLLAGSEDLVMPLQGKWQDSCDPAVTYQVYGWLCIRKLVKDALTSTTVFQFDVVDGQVTRGDRTKMSYDPTSGGDQEIGWRVVSKPRGRRFLWRRATGGC